MILRKPYAFLIRYFKIIHIFLFIMCCFLLFKLRSIYIFFQEYVKTDTYQYIENIAEKYIGLPMIIISLLIFVSAILILLLMKKKEKPVLFYRILIAYSLGLIILIIFYYNFYKSLEFQIYDRAVLSIYRDIVGLFYYIMFFFIGFTFVRGFGFDIKKFSFEKDLKLLNITEADNEEFELAVNIDKESIVNAVRKEKRFAKYFLKENVVVISIILVFLLCIIGISIYNYFYVENVIYEQSDNIVANGLQYQIKNVYFTNKDKINNQLGYNYVIVDFSITNLNNQNEKLDLLKTRLIYNEKVYHSILNQYNYFDDIGVGYNNQILKPNEKYNYILVFRVDNELLNESKIYLEVFEKEFTKNNVLTIDYKKTLLNVIELKEKNVIDATIGDEILFNNNFINDGKLKINGYEFNNEFIHKYSECDGNNCTNYNKVIQSSEFFPIMKIDYELANIDLNQINSYFSVIINDNSVNETKEFKLNLLYNDENSAYFEIIGDLDKYSFEILRINIRGSIYQIKLN